MLLGLALGLIAPTAAAGAAAAPAAMRGDAEAVVLGPLDQIEVNIDNYPDMRTTTRVGADGAVTLPLVGRVGVSGMTPPAAANEIETRYVNGGFIKMPSIRIEILDYQSRKASVLGQVNNQGLIALDRVYSIAEILARAGGLAADAADTAVIIRKKPDGSSEQLTIDLGQMMSATGPGAHATAPAGALTTVRAGDVVFVPKAPSFSVIGSVNRAGTYPLRTGTTIDQALATAGDINEFGTRSKLQVRRTPPTGGPATIVAVGPDDVVQPGDVIVVRARLF